jgi:hypothetical protein
VGSIPERGNGFVRWNCQVINWSLKFNLFSIWVPFQRDTTVLGKLPFKKRWNRSGFQIHSYSRESRSGWLRHQKWVVRSRDFALECQNPLDWTFRTSRCRIDSWTSGPDLWMGTDFHTRTLMKIGAVHRPGPEVWLSIWPREVPKVQSKGFLTLCTCEISKYDPYFSCRPTPDRRPRG